MTTARKLFIVAVVFVGSLLLLRVNGWFGLGAALVLPIVILLWFDLGRELRASSSTSRLTRLAGVLMGVPQALFGAVCAAAGIAIVYWVLYNSFWERDPHYSGSFLSFGIGPVLVLIGAGFIADAFRRAPPSEGA
jgi:hypothetical protein